jgi:competence protein ComEC
VIPLRIGLTSLARGIGFCFSDHVVGSVGARLRQRCGFFSTLFGGVHPISAALAKDIVAERDRWFPWTVVAFASGSLLYFALPVEPAYWIAAAIAGVGALTAFKALRTTRFIMRFFCALIAACCFGFAGAKLRTEIVSAPIISSDMGPLTIEGRIETVLLEDAANARIVLAPVQIGENTEALPRRVRLSLRGERAVSVVKPGLRVSLLAMLRPPPEPALPGGYDFARWAFFSGIGGVGFVLGAPAPLDLPETEKWRARFAASIERLRGTMSARIQAALPGPDGAISAALITGERAAISEDDNNAYRDSGLFHVLSISGVHMALAGLGIFWIVRALLALFPRIALIYPIKKWSACAAIAGATFYLFLSGASAPAVRSYIMLLVMLIGVLADRPALSMRSVAISALLLLAIEPEGIIEPSFQMSFAAIIGLIALAEWQRARPLEGVPPETSIDGALRWTRRYFVGLICASMVAGLATAPFAIYHFDRAPGYSLLANLLATPVVGAVIMPAACFGAALMPFGLEYVPLQIMGWGVGLMTDIAHWVAGLPGAVNLVPAKSGMVLVLIAAGGLWIGLWQRRWRWFGVTGLVLGLGLAAFEKAPDILIARDASAAPVRGTDGVFILLGRLDDYTAEQWLLRDGDARPAELASEGARCDEWGCLAQDGEGRVVALAFRAGALADDCARADIIVSAVPLRRTCNNPIYVIDSFDVFREGAIALFTAGGEIGRRTVAGERGARPWVQRH